MRTPLAGLTGAVAALLPVAVSAQVGGLSMAPAHPDPANPATRSYFVHSLPPGGTFRDQVKVGNTGSSAINLLLYPVDGLTAATSGAVYGNRGDATHKTAHWITTAVSTLALPPRSTALIDFTVHVPVDAVPGDHLAGIAFEDAAPASSGSGRLRVTTVARGVVGVLVEVAGPATFSLQALSASLGPVSGQTAAAALSITLKNDGRLLGRPSVAVTLSGPNGYHGTRTKQLDTVLPGDQVSVVVPWPDRLGAGDYAVTITGEGPGMPERQVLTTTCRIGGTCRPVPAGPALGRLLPSPASKSSWASLLVASLLGLAALVGVFFVDNRRRMRARAG